MLSVYSYKRTPDFVISKIAKWAVFEGVVSEEDDKYDNYDK